MKKLFLVLLIGILCLPFFDCFTPRVQAFEPVTMMVLAPVAVEVYKVAQPQITKGAASAGKQIIKVGGDMLEILYLPLGAVQCTAGMPFGAFGSGINNIGKGLIAPGKMVLDLVLLPLCLFGASF